jgi:hypothetical protein
MKKAAAERSFLPATVPIIDEDLGRSTSGAVDRQVSTDWLPLCAPGRVVFRFQSRSQFLARYPVAFVNFGIRPDPVPL